MPLPGLLASGGLIFAFFLAIALEIRSSSQAIYQQRYELLRTEV